MDSIKRTNVCVKKSDVKSEGGVSCPASRGHFRGGVPGRDEDRAARPGSRSTGQLNRTASRAPGPATRARLDLNAGAALPGGLTFASCLGRTRRRVAGVRGFAACPLGSRASHHVAPAPSSAALSPVSVVNDPADDLGELAVCLLCVI